ncbi:hypothetical protein RhiJN_05927 [Ceratobasidium sp. AG-Ba]|nr:hypothetical protein RhiJN_05927 [Ceratobasidium sp. AG-Ba]QRW06851.1 hypothetical protein RhiLY_05850 [Ceratobasidium sp. AG-Ba]
MAGGRSKAKLVLARDIEHHCTCISYKCSLRPEGYKKVKQKAYNEHKRADEFLKLRQSNVRRGPSSRSIPPARIVPDIPAVDDERLAFPQTSEHTNNNTEISEDIIHPDPLMRSRSSSFGSENDNNDFLEPLSEANHTPPSPSSLRNPSSQHSRPSSPVAGNAQSSDSNSAVILEPGDTPDMFERPTFVKEHRSIRLTYIKVAALHIVHHQDVLASNLDLKISLDCLWETGLDIPRNPKPATTQANPPEIPSAQERARRSVESKLVMSVAHD